MLKKILTFIIFIGLVLPLFRTASADVPSQPCRSFQTNSGYLFDDFQKIEYINGFLTIHLKLKTPYNDGRPWGTGFYLFKANCAAQFYQLFSPGFSPRAKMQFFSIRFTSLTHFEFWDDEQDIQFDCSTICSGDIPDNISDGSGYVSVSYFGTVDNGISTVLTVSSPLEQPQPQREPVLIIPGLLASQLEYTGDVLWPNLEKTALDAGDSFMDALDFDQNGKPILPGVRATSVIGKINYVLGNFDYSDGLIKEFTDKGYEMGKDLFTFPYDWRLSVAENTALLKTEISQIEAATHTQFVQVKINIIAHSLGGLILKQYLSTITQAEEDNIDNIVFVGTPQLGSAEAAKELIFGGHFDKPFLSEDEMFKLSQNMPSIYDLLPSREYFKHIAGFYDDLVNQAVKSILNYDQSKALLQNIGKNSILLNQSEAMHSNDFDNFDFSAKNYHVFNVVSCGVYTLKTINKMYISKPTILQRFLAGPKYRIYGDSGDGTVLTRSAAYLNIPQSNLFYLHNVGHSDMLSNGSGKQLVAALATGQSFSDQNISHSTDNCQIKDTLVSLDSSLNFNVTNLLTNQPIDPALIRTVKVGDDVHLILPEDAGQKYKITATPKTPQATTAKHDISISKVNSDNTQIYNYNQLNIVDYADINLADAADTLSNADPSGNLTQIPPTDTFDQSQLDNALPDAPPPPTSPAPVYQPQPVIDISNVPNSSSGSNPQSPNASPQQPADYSQGPQSGDDSADNSEDPGADVQEDSAPAQNSGPQININFDMPQTSPQSALDDKVDQNDTESNDTEQPSPASSEIIVVDQPPFFWRIFSRIVHLIFF